MAVLRRKLVRDFRDNRGVLLTVVVIIGVGAGLHIGLASAQRILETSQRDYYARHRFADFWIDLKKAPLTAVDPLARLPGVAEIETRIVFDVILDVPGEVQPLRGRLISVPAGRPGRGINGIHLLRGPGFSRDRDAEVIVAEDFAQAHGLKPGDRLDLILNRRQQTFIIVGAAISPEYVFMVRGQGDFVPDPRHFGVLYVKDDFARQVLGFQGAFNQVIGRLMCGYEDNINPLLDRMDRILEPYGVLAAIPRDRQASHRFVTDEIQGLATSAVIFPTIFLVVAALVLNLVMARFSEHQRTIIGTLKALGYTNRQVLSHFLHFGWVVGGLGGLLGIGTGLALAYAVIQMYRTFFHFPVFAFQVYPGLLAAGLGISVIFALAGAANGVRAVLRLHPAEAMRGRPPERGGAVFLERFRGLWRQFGFRTHMALRSLLRNRVRTLTGVLSTAAAAAIVLSTMILYDSTWFIVSFQFNHVVHSDIDLALRDEAAALDALAEVRRLPAVDDAEPVFSLVCDARHGPVARRLAITGLAPTHRLTTPSQTNLVPVRISPVGLTMGRKLAEVLRLRPGDTLELTPVRGRRQTVRVPVASLIDGFLGLECYADLGYLSRLVGETEIVNSLQLAVNEARVNDLFAAIKQLPNVQGISLRREARANIESTFIRSLSFTLGLTIVFAGVIAFGATLNTALIELYDRRTQIATLHVMGYRPRQIAGIFFRESTVIFVLGLAVSIPMGYLMAVGISTRYNTELFRMPIFLRGQTVAIALGVLAAFLLVVQIVVYRQIARTDLLEGIKVKE